MCGDVGDDDDDMANTLERIMKEQELVSYGWAGKSWIQNQWLQYKLNHSDWKRLWEEQEGKCAGCGREFAHPFDKSAKMGLKPQTDHRHVEGRQCETRDVRGLLCRRCNDFLGKIQDNMDVLEGLLAHLRKHGDLK